MVLANSDDRELLTISEIAQLYQMSPSSVRLKLKNHPGAKSARKERDGPKGYRHPVDMVEEVFKKRPEQNLITAWQSIPPKQSRFSTSAPVVFGLSPRDDDVLVGILKSRTEAETAYGTLLKKMIGSEQGLRIRCITGTDFFNSHHPTAVAFTQRGNNPDLGKTRVLVVYPFGNGACIRSAAEGDPEPRNSQFSRDAASTFAFVRYNRKKFNLEVKWVENIPLNLLIWTEEGALLEPYDHGRLGSDFAGCIGRKAPIMIVKGGTEYHKILKNGFDYEFEEDPKKTHIRIYSLDEVQEVYDRGIKVTDPKQLQRTKAK